jgi:peptidyl-prolyl isomerase D
MTENVFFDITIGGRPRGRIVFKLFDQVTPKTCNNFRTLAKGDLKSKVSGALLSYKGCKFHRIIKGFMLQAGDFTKGNGTGGESIYGTKVFCCPVAFSRNALK